MAPGEERQQLGGAEHADLGLRQLTDVRGRQPLDLGLGERLDLGRGQGGHVAFAVAGHAFVAMEDIHFTETQTAFQNVLQQRRASEAGRITDEIYWDRITYFLKRIVPVAEEAGVKIACHPQDPAMPRDTGWRGVNTVLGTPDGLKRFV